jgi:uncharacterized protein (UPF0332 family)
MNEELLPLIRYRLKEADDSIAEAKLLLKAGMSLRAVANRLYYAMFYSVLALLQEKQMGTSKHFGAISLFDREFIKTGIFDKEMSKTLHRAFELRQKADYLEQADVSRADVEELLPKAIEFAARTKSHLLNRK